MFEPSSTLRRPQNSRQTLWRYLTAERLRDMLATGELYFAHLPQFEDEYEGALTDRSRERLALWFEHHNNSSRTAAYAEVEKYQEQREKFYVNCWHMNDHESYLMWKAYSGRGYAIRTTFERLQASLESDSHPVTGGVVDYVDFDRDLTSIGNVFTHVATKDMPYRDEREFRLVLWTADQRNAHHTSASPGLRVPVNLRMLVQCIVRSPHQESPDSELKEIAKSLGLELSDSRVRAKRAR